ncbi:hypothetical protein ASF25_20755 [Methylobacterium sp. Leaf100]|nr:hypothetical protein ASF25_20755 [Methylobacterium sp. Leaf100]
MERPIRWRDGLAVLLEHGDLEHMANAFEVSERYGKSNRNELVCMLGYMRGVVLRDIRPYSEGWYLLTRRGVAKRARSRAKGPAGA